MITKKVVGNKERNIKVIYLPKKCDIEIGDEVTIEKLKKEEGESIAIS
jgi:hypothetical protein